MAKETFGQRLCRLRKEKGLTQGDIADRLNVSVQAVSKWENDQAIPDIATLPYLADLLDVSTDTLLGRETDVYVSDKEEINMDDIVARIRIISNDGDTVRINLPLAALSMAKSIAMKEGVEDSDLKILDNLDSEKIEEMVKNGCLGDLINIQSSDGDIVHIYLCHLNDKDKEADEHYFRARFRSGEKSASAEKEKTIDSSSLSKWASRKADLQKKINDLVERMGNDDEDTDSLTQELAKTSQELSQLSEWDNLEAQRIEKEEQIKEDMELLKNGKGDAMGLATEIAKLKKDLKEIKAQQEEIRSKEGSDNEDQSI